MLTPTSATGSAPSPRRSSTRPRSKAEPKVKIKTEVKIKAKVKIETKGKVKTKAKSKIKVMTKTWTRSPTSLMPKIKLKAMKTPTSTSTSTPTPTPTSTRGIKARMSQKTHPLGRPRRLALLGRPALTLLAPGGRGVPGTTVRLQVYFPLMTLGTPATRNRRRASALRPQTAVHSPRYKPPLPQTINSLSLHHQLPPLSIINSPKFHLLQPLSEMMALLAVQASHHLGCSAIQCASMLRRDTLLRCASMLRRDTPLRFLSTINVPFPHHQLPPGSIINPFQIPLPVQPRLCPGWRNFQPPSRMMALLAIQASHHQRLWAILSINFLHPHHQLPPHPTIIIPQPWQHHRPQLPLHNPCPRRVGGADPCPARPLGAGPQPSLQAGLRVGPLPRDSPGKGRHPLTRGWCLTFLRGRRRWTLPSPR